MKVIVYTRTEPPCGYCVRAKALLARKGIEFEERPADHPEFPAGATTVPQIVITCDATELSCLLG